MASESNEKKTNVIVEEVLTEEKIAKEVYTSNKCNGCGGTLPKVLDKGICPFCGIRN